MINGKRSSAKLTTTRGKKNGMVSAHDIMKRHQISYQTLNHYTNFGLLPVSVKMGNIRFYNKSMVDKRIKKVRVLMSEGYSLGLIRKTLIGI
ncbi:MerR family transcriptional regulator [Candidatus Omnitrophota bacterium]